MRIRSETPQDIDAIRALTAQAFAQAEHSSGTEGAIIAALRAAAALTLSLVAVSEGEIRGHAAFSPVTVAGQDSGWFGLGPVSVGLGFQRLGTGSLLIREGLARLQAGGALGCVVLGDPQYYQRFGFRSRSGLTLEGVPPDYFMALAFTALPPRAAVTYHPAFGLS